MIASAEPLSNRARLLAEARKLFAEKGFADVSVDEIAAAAGLTKGAVYYQFKDKTDLFRAACADLLAGLSAMVEGHTMAQTEHSVDEILHGGLLLFDLYESEAARRLLLIDGPAVLGFEDWTELQAPLRVGLAEHALYHLSDAGLIPKSVVPAMAHLIFGAFTQGVLHIASSDDPMKAGKDVRAAYRTLVESMLRPKA